LDIVEHLTTAAAIAAHNVAMTIAAQVFEVLARHHAAVADKDDAFEPEALLEIAQNIRDRFGIAPIALEHMMSDRPAVDQNQTNQHLRVSRLAIAAVAMGAHLGRSSALKIGRGQIVEHHVDLKRKQVAQPHKQRVLDLRLAREQLVERAIPLLQLSRRHAHARCPAGLAFRVVAPCRDEAPTATITDKIALQPLRQRMLAGRRRQPIGHQHKSPITQPHRLAAIGPRELVECRVEAEIAPHPARRQQRPPVPRSDRPDILVRDAIVAGRIAMQQPAELAEIEVLRQHIPTTEIDDGAMPRLAVAVAIGFDHAHIFAFHALADRCSDYTQEHDRVAKSNDKPCPCKYAPQYRRFDNPNKPVPTKRRKSDTRPSKFNHLARNHPFQMSNIG